MTYLLSRLVTTAVTLLAAMILLFALTALIPGDPATILLGPQVSPEAAARFIHEMGLDQPVHVRFGRFLGHLLVGDLGTDVVDGRRVWDVVAGVLPYTLALTGSAMGLSVLAGVPLGAYAAARPGSWVDGALAGVSVAFIAIPSFVVAILLLLAFSITLHWLPVLGAGRAGDWGDQGQRLILPTLALAAGWVGYLARLVRSSMLEVLKQPFIRTAHAYGVPPLVVTFKYALRNAFIPPLAVLGLGVGRLLGGAVLVETVFARPGLGRLVLDAINTRNYPVLQGAVLVVVALFVAANLAADLLQIALDPRVRRE